MDDTIMRGNILRRLTNLSLINESVKVFVNHLYIMYNFYIIRYNNSIVNFLLLQYL